MTCQINTHTHTHIAAIERTNVVPICQYVHRVKQLNVRNGKRSAFLPSIKFHICRANTIITRQQERKEMGTAHFNELTQTY